jgi:hypothetical protein
MSKFFEALEEADQHHRSREGAPVRWRATVPPDGDTLAGSTARVARWTGEGRIGDEGSARVQDGKQESPQLPEQATSRFRLPTPAIRRTAIWLAAGVGIAAISGVAGLYRDPLWTRSERATPKKPIGGPPAVAAEWSVSARAEADADGRREGNLPAALVEKSSAAGAPTSPTHVHVTTAGGPEFTDRPRTVTSTDVAETAPDDPGAIIGWLIKERSKGGR